MSNKRIIALSEKVTPDSGDFFAMDNSSGGTKKYQVKKILDQIAENAEDISDLNNAINKSVIGKKYTMTYKSGKYIDKTNGTEKNDSGSMASNYVPIGENVIELMPVLTTSEGEYNAFYDENKNFINAPLNLQSERVTVPANARYFRISKFVATTAINIYPVLNMALLNNIDTFTDNTFKNTVGFVNKDVFPKEIVNNGTNITLGQISGASVSADEFTFVASGADISFGAAATVGQQYAAKNGCPISVSPGDAVTVNVTGQSFAKNYMSIYNSSGECIYQTGNKWTANFTEIMPENAAFITLRIGRQGASSGNSYTTKILVFINKNTTVTDSLNILTENVGERSLMGLPNIRSIAHQGYTPLSGYNWCKEKGYIDASKVGFTYGECDIRFSSDAVPMCSHDASFTDSSTSATVVIADHTADELQTYNYHAGKIARFEEVVKACKLYGLGLYIDQLSYTWTDANWTSIFNIVEKYGMKNRVAWVTNEATFVSRIVAFDSTAEIVPLISFTTVQAVLDVITALKTASNKITVNFDYSTVTANNLISIRQAISADTRIELYTVDTATDYEDLLPYIDGITSNKISPYILTQN